MTEAQLRGLLAKLEQTGSGAYQLAAAVPTLLDELSTLRRALEPFAKFRAPEHSADEAMILVNISVGDLLYAKAVLNTFPLTPSSLPILGDDDGK